MVVPFLMFGTFPRFVKMRLAAPGLTVIAGAIIAGALPELATAQGPPTAQGLSGTVWRVLQFQAAGQSLKPDDQSDYTVEFRTDSTIAMSLDCRRGRGTWISRSGSQLELGPVALTRADCPRSPLLDQIAKQWSSVRSYVIRDGHLFLSANDGTYELEPQNMAAAQSRAPAPPQAAAAQPRVASQPLAASWLDAPKPVSWNTASAIIPTAPKLEGAVDPRCRSLARTPELEADRKLAASGWDLIGAYQGGWGILVIQATAGYDGMCRPRAYQNFVFVRGAFAGTLSPQPMDSRSDGALSRVTLQNNGRLIAEYARYAKQDALCCASKTASVVFEIGPGASLAQPVSIATSSNRSQ